MTHFKFNPNSTVPEEAIFSDKIVAASPAAVKKTCPAIHISTNKNKVAKAYRKLFFVED